MAVIRGEGDFHHLNLGRLTVLHHNGGIRACDGKDGAVAGGEEGSKGRDSKHSKIGNGKGSRLKLVGAETAPLCLADKVLRV